MPLEPDDEFSPDRVAYIYRANSLYNRRFEQRRRLKEVLGKRRRPLVETAKRRSKTLFLDLLTREEADAIRRMVNVEPAIFWRVCAGRTFLDLPPPLVQRELDFGREEP